MHPTLEAIRGTVGLWSVGHEGVMPSKIDELAGRIEASGFRVFWTPEAYGREAMTGAQLLLGASRSLVVGTGIASIYARDPMATASSARTLAERYPGRFVLGLGVSHRPLVERGRGGTYDAPIKAMTRYLDGLEAAPVLSAEHGVVVPSMLAALGPRMLEVAASRTDGALTYLVTVDHTANAREILGEGFLAVEQSVVLGQGRDEFLRRAHEHLNVYTGLDNYRASWRRIGFDDDDFVRGGSERLCDALVVHGDTDAIMERVAAHFDAGADHVCLQVLGETLVDLPLREWDELGEAVGAP